MYDAILVPTDGSEHARRAAEHAAALADAFDAALHVVTVVDLNAAAGPFSAGGLDDREIQRLKDRRAEAIEAVESAIDATGDLHTEVVTGRPGKAILQYAGEHGVDLIAMGTHGRSGVRRAIAGSVAEHVVRRATVPVITVRATDRSRVGDGYQDVLVPTDGSDHAATAAAHGVAIAAAFDARVHAVHVVDVGAAATTPSVSPPTTLLDQLKSAGEEATEAVAERAREAGIDVRTQVREGLPSRHLLEYSAEHDVDLIAMGSAGRTGLDRYLVGSTTERVIRRAEMPVLSVTAGEE
ncbi:universal stress protein [Halomicrobium salinisoli]|uniref:universal stress protein n=1 Tax=Halomicrobium salinisoli TaxID=2878391 RepID=UPI001CEFE011|nr:universal stress protein [Halomicrobium salinisoli]